MTALANHEHSEFRVEIRNFVQNNIPREIAEKVRLGLELTKTDIVCWQKILREHGLFAGAWPVEFGGQGWDLERQLAFTQEAALSNAPPISPFGVNMLGPVVYTFGTEEQKRLHLPGILESDIWWCQGYSEPNAGSDLASLQTFAEDAGDHYVVNGTKMWTTEAHWADMMHCLVRTDRTGKPQRGITFLLIDMQTPGITVRPIITIDGQYHTNQVFFDNVIVPVGNRVGDAGDGWKIAKFLLSNERVAIADTGPKLRLMNDLRKLYEDLNISDSVPQELKIVLGDRLTDLEIQLETLCALERSAIREWDGGGSKEGPVASILKIRGTEVLQAMSELALDLEGPLAAAHDPLDLHLPSAETFSAAQYASFMGHQYLYGRCWSIFGGSNEIQRNIIARHALGN